MRLALGAVPDYVRFVPVDFNSQTLESELPAFGFDSHARTLFILEGVTMYIERSGTEATLAFVRSRSASRSRIVFDYMTREARESADRRPFGMEVAAKALAEHGEPLVTGWTQGELAALVRSTGLRMNSDLSSEELGELYLRNARGDLDGRVLGGNRIVEAETP